MEAGRLSQEQIATVVHRAAELDRGQGAASTPGSRPGGRWQVQVPPVREPAEPNFVCRDGA